MRIKLILIKKKQPQDLGRFVKNDEPHPAAYAWLVVPSWSLYLHDLCASTSLRYGELYVTELVASTHSANEC